jgi:FAD/FMN-containing dehydrogenase
MTNSRDVAAARRTNTWSMVSSNEVLGRDSAAVQQYVAALRGDLLTPDDPEYDQARRVWNHMIDKRPALIARCASEADVLRSIEFARERDLTVAVRGGGHSVAGYATCDDGLLIDLSQMKGLRIDAAHRTATAQPGLRLGEFDRATQEVGLATPLGIVANTGIAGLTLGGGLGWLNGKYGLACDNVLSAHVATADGRLLTASPTEHPDLFWALRGGGGNFGVVTQFVYRLNPVGPVIGGMTVYPLSEAKQVLSRYGELARACPDELTTAVFLILGPDGAPAVAIAVCYCGPATEGEAVVGPYRRLGTPAADMVASMSYVEQQGSFDAGFPPQRLHYWKAGFLDTLSDDAIEVMLESLRRMPSSMSGIGLQHLHGAAARVGTDETAFTHRFDFWDVPILAQWSEPSDSERNIAWARETYAALEPFSKAGVYVNNLGTEGDERVRAAYGPNYARLASVKGTYDPTNFFHLNQNIAPA